jgi:uncharacterized protein YkwD
VRRTPALLACASAALAMLLSAGPAWAGAEKEAIDALNEVRRGHGLSAMRVSDDLNRSSDRYARRMIAHDYFGHLASIDVDGGFRSAGETLAWHTGWNAQPRRTVDRWMASPGHRTVLLSSNFRWVGMGLVRGRLGSRLVSMWVAHVGGR